MNHPVRHIYRERFLICLLSMGATFLVMLILMKVYELAPCGNSSLAAADCKIQYLDFFNYYKDVLSGKNRIGYTLTKGLGSNGVGLFSYYLASPFNLLMYFFDGTQANTVIDLLIFIKLGLSAATFAYFLQARLYDRLSPFLVVLLSAGYGLSHYSFSNGNNLMWLDGMYLLPLMLLGTHLLVRRRSIAPLAVPTALSIIFNWYTGGINCLFCIIWLVFEFFWNEITPEGGPGIPESNAFGSGISGPEGILKRFAGTVVRYGAAMVLGIAISAFLFLPAIVSLQMGRGSGFYLSEHMINVFKGNMWNTISQYRIDGHSDKTMVSLYCGSLAAIGTFAFFLTRRVRIGQKITAAGLLAITLLTYYWQPMIFTFSLFNSVYSYYSRYGYAGSLVLLFLCAMYLQHVLPADWAAAEELSINGELKKTEWLVPIVGCAIFCLLLFTVGDHPTIETKGAVETCIYMLGTAICVSVLLAARTGQNISRRRVMTALAGGLLTVIALGELYRCGVCLLKYNRLEGVDSYVAYVADSKEQVSRLKEYDSGLYRISQIGWRNRNDEMGTTANYNDALAYNYMGIGGYTSSPENDHMYLLHRLGYKEDNRTMNIVNTSFVPADSMLGVRYVFSNTDIAGMEKIAGLGEYQGRETYYNPNALPLAFTYSGAMLPDHEYHNPFEYLEEIWTALAGEEAHIFTPLQTEKTLSGKTTTWTIKIPEGNVGLYGNLPWEDDNPSMLKVGESDPIGYSQWLAPTVFTIPFKEGDSTVVVSLTPDKDFVPKEEQFFALDLDRLRQLADKIGKGAEQVSNLTMENGEISCTVTAHEGEKLFLILPRTKGWNTYVNGEATETEEFAYCLTVIPLREGENRIEMSYRVPNLRKGILLTLVGILLLAAYEIWAGCYRDLRGRRRR